MTQEISNKEDMLDVRDIIARFEELEASLEAHKEEPRRSLVGRRGRGNEGSANLS